MPYNENSSAYFEIRMKQTMHPNHFFSTSILLYPNFKYNLKPKLKTQTIKPALKILERLKYVH